MKESLFGAVIVSIILATVVVTGGTPNKPASASPVVVVGSPPGIEARLRTEIDALKAELARATDDLRSDRDRLLVKQSSPSVPRAPAVVATSVALPAAERSGGFCAGGVCMPAQAPRQYQQRTYRSGPVRRLFGR